MLQVLQPYPFHANSFWAHLLILRVWSHKVTMLVQAYLQIGGWTEERDTTIGSRKPEYSLN